MPDKCCPGGAAPAGDNLQGIFRHTCLVQDSCETHTGKRGLGRGLDEDAVSGDKSGAGFPGQNKSGHIPGDNRRTHTQRIFADDAGPVFPQCLSAAADSSGDGCIIFEDVGDTLNLISGFVEWLALLGCKEHRQVVLLCPDLSCGPKEYLSPCPWLKSRPGQKGCFRPPYGFIHVSCCRFPDGSDTISGRRIGYFNIGHISVPVPFVTILSGVYQESPDPSWLCYRPRQGQVSSFLL